MKSGLFGVSATPGQLAKDDYGISPAESCLALRLHEPEPETITDPAALLVAAIAGERTLPEVEHLVRHAIGFDDPQLLRAARRALAVTANMRRTDGLAPSPRVAKLLADVRARLAAKTLSVQATRSPRQPL